MTESYKFIDFLAYAMFFLVPPMFLIVETYEFIQIPVTFFILSLSLVAFVKIWRDTGLRGYLTNWNASIFVAVTFILGLSFVLDKVFGSVYSFKTIGILGCITMSFINMILAFDKFRLKEQVDNLPISKSKSIHLVGVKHEKTPAN